MQPATEPNDNSLHLPLSLCLSFNFVCEVKITFVELVNSNIAIFSSTCVAFSVRVNSNGICGPIRLCSCGFEIGKTYSTGRNVLWRDRSPPRKSCDRIWLRICLVELFSRMLAPALTENGEVAKRSSLEQTTSPKKEAGVLGTQNGII